MRTRFTVAVSMLAGAALGGAAIQALHAQAKPPVYMVAMADISESRTTDEPRDDYFRPLTATMLNFAYFSPILSAA